MGATFYCYVAQCQEDLQKVLDDLRLAELEVGRYVPCFERKTGKYLFDYPLVPRHE